MPPRENAWLKYHHKDQDWIDRRARHQGGAGLRRRSVGSSGACRHRSRHGPLGPGDRQPPTGPQNPARERRSPPPARAHLLRERPVRARDRRIQRGAENPARLRADDTRDGIRVLRRGKARRCDRRVYDADSAAARQRQRVSEPRDPIPGGRQLDRAEVAYERANALGRRPRRCRTSASSVTCGDSRAQRRRTGRRSRLDAKDPGPPNLGDALWLAGDRAGGLAAYRRRSSRQRRVAGQSKGGADARAGRVLRSEAGRGDAAHTDR